MRKFTDISNKLYLILFTVCLLHSCGKDEVGSDGESVIKGNVPDPDGTISVSMRNGDKGDATFIDNCFYIGQDNNFSPRYYNCSFTCVGKVNGLGNITGIPEKGWSDKIAVEPGNGYVINYRGLVDEPVNKYYSLYVSDYITSTYGGIIGANVKYLTPFYGKDVEIKLDPEDKRFQIIDNEMHFIINNLKSFIFRIQFYFNIFTIKWCQIFYISTYYATICTGNIIRHIKAVIFVYWLIH